MASVGAGGAVSLRLDAGDLAQLRIGPTWGPFSELLFSLDVLWQPRPHPLVTAWQHAVAGRLGDRIAPLRLLVAAGSPVDLHTIVGEAPDIDHALEALASAPADHLVDELEPLRRSATGSASWARDWLHDLARGDGRARGALVGLLHRYHREAIAPYWERIRAHLDAENARCGELVLRRGVGGLLGDLHPSVRWRPPSTLEVRPGPRSSASPTIHAVGGRQLVLVPSVFCIGGARLFRSSRGESSPYVLVYPALRELCDAAWVWAAGTEPPPAALAKLLGTTRANALRAIAGSRPAAPTTTGLARQLGVAVATASHHLGVLRDAHLITSSRRGTEVVHRVTPLGAALLAGGHGRPEPLARPSRRRERGTPHRPALCGGSDDDHGVAV